MNFSPFRCPRNISTGPMKTDAYAARKPAMLVHSFFRRAKENKVLVPVLLLHVAVAAACDGETRAEAGAAVVRDSAGIQIVESVSAKWKGNNGWKVGDTATVDIGEAEGDTNYQLFRAFGAVRLSDGRIVVANAGTHQLRFYDRDGGYLFSSGRKGGGPGEFENFALLGRFGDDSLLTFDYNSSRVSVFAPDGKFARSFAVSSGGGPGFLSPQAIFPDGSLLLQSGTSFVPGIRSGIHRDSALFVVFAPQGVVRDTVGSFPGRESFVVSDAQSVSVTSRTFGRNTVAAIHGERIYIGSGDSYEIGIYARDGALKHLVRKRHNNPNVTAEDIDQFEQKQLESATDENWKRVTRSFIEKMEYPKTFPAYSGILVDVAGNLWVREYDKPGDKQPLWTVFGADGRMLGSVTTPKGLRLLEVGADFILGRWTDDADIEHVGIFPLVKPGSG